MATAIHRWTYFTDLSPGTLRSRAELFMESTPWSRLLTFAAERGMGGELLPAVGLGHNHMVRIIEGTSSNRWIVRLELPPISATTCSEHYLQARRDNEVNVVTFCAKRRQSASPRSTSVILATPLVSHSQSWSISPGTWEWTWPCPFLAIKSQRSFVVLPISM